MAARGDRVMGVLDMEDGAPAVSVRLADLIGPDDESTLLRALLENSRDLTVVVDGTGAVIWASGNVQELLGYRVDELLGRNAFELIVPEHLDAAAHRFAEIVDRAVRPEPLLLEVRCKDGSSLALEALGTALPDLTAEPLVMVNLRDARPRLEAERALRESEARLRTVVHASYDVVAVVDATATVTWVTANAVRLLGWTPEEVVGRSGLDFVHPDDHEPMLTELEAFTSGAGIPNPTTIRMLHKDGTWHHVELVGTDLLDNPDIGGIALNLRGVDDRVATERRLEHDATHDPLTGLPNRTLLLDRLEQALRRSQRLGTAVAVLFCDLDRFKVVNDRLGHEAGDRLLASIATRLVDHLRPGDTVGRYGGDEFVVLCEDLSDPDDAAGVADRMLSSLEEGFHVAGHEILVGMSIGVAVAPKGEGTVDELLRRADQAMYRAKHHHRAVAP